MGRKASIITIAALALGLAGLIASAARADGVTYCVICKKPKQVYVCRITGEGSRPRDAFKLYCIVRLAKEGNHASCKAKDRAQCHGIERTYSLNDLAIPPSVADDPRVRQFQRKVAREREAFEKPEGEGPQTLVDLTGRAISASRKGFRNVRDRIRGTPDEPSPPVQAAARPKAEPSETTAPIALTPPEPQSTAALPDPPPTEAMPAPERITPDDAEDAERPSRFKRMTNAVKSAGSAVGGFAGRSYRCVRSLFRNCRSETASADLQ